MNLSSLKSRLPWAIIFVVIIIISIGILLFLNISKGGALNENTKPNQSLAPNTIAPPQIKSTDLPTAIQEIRKSIIANPISDNNGDLLIYEEGGFQIEYITSPDIFFVKINKDPANENKQKAQNWFKEKGLKQEDLCNLSVRFLLTTLEIRQANPNFNTLPDNCDAPLLKKP